MTRRAPALALISVCAVGAFGCSRREATVVVAASAVTSASTSTTSTASSTPAVPVVTARAEVSILGPGPQRVERDALEVLALSLRAANTGADAIDVTGLTLRATGALDDAVATTTARLAIDRDGDGRFDRAIDRVLASAGFAADDGPLPFTFLPVAVAPGAAVDLLVLLDLSGRGVAHQDLRLSIERVDATDPRGAPALVAIAAEIGPWLRLGGWVTPHEALSVAGEALRPRAVRDGQGRTHVGLFQNLNMTSNVWYSVHDGRSYSPPDNVSRASRTAWNQDLALDGDLPHLVWEEVDTGTNDYAIRHSQFDPVAFRWTTPLVLSGHNGMQLSPRVLASPGGVVDVVWEDWGSSGVAPRVAHRRRAGGVWSNIAEVTSASASSSLQAREPAVAPLTGGDVLVAWVENEPGRSEVRARVLSAGGAWGPVEVVAVGAGVLARAELLDDAGSTHLLFVDSGEVLHARRTAQGWSRPVNVSRSAADPSSEPAMAVWQGVLHVAWLDAVGAGSHVATAHLTGGGFSAPELLTLGQGDVSRKCPAVVPEGDRLRLLWQDRRLGRQRIYTTWRDAGPLEAPRPAVTGAGDPGRPDLAEGVRGELHVVYSVDAGGNGEVFHAVEERPGEGFAAPVNISRSAGGSYQPTVAALGSAVHAAWEEQQAGGAFTIVTTTRQGATWSTPATVSSATRAYAPRLSTGGGRAALVWTQETSANDFDVQLSLHDGQRFPVGRAVAPLAGSSAWNPDVAVSPTGVTAVAWEEEGARREIVVATIGASTASVTTSAVASSPSGQYAPRLAWAREDLVVAWVEDGRARVATRRAGQAAFDAPIDLSSGGSWAPDVVADRDGNTVVIVWEQWTGNDARVVLTTLPVLTTGTPVPLDEAPGPARRVAAAAGPFGGVHVAWTAQGSLFVRSRRAR